MPNALSDDIILGIQDALIELFATRLSMDIKPLETDLPECEDKDQLLVGSVSLAGKVQGRVNFYVSQTVACMMSAAMRGMELEAVEDGEDVRDVLREVCNIAAGGLKSNFCDAGLTCEISTPSITSGSNFEDQTLDMDHYEKFAFKLDDHNLLVEVGVMIDEDAASEVAEDAAEGAVIVQERLDDNAIQDMRGAAGEERPSSTADDEGHARLDQAASQAMLDNASDKAANSETPFNGTDDVAPVAKAPHNATQTNGGPKTALVDEAAPPSPKQPFDVGVIRDIPVQISVELGRCKMAIKDVMGLGQGSAVVLANLEGELLDIRANNRLIAKGEVLVENDKYGIRIKEIITSCERLDQLIR